MCLQLSKHIMSDEFKYLLLIGYYFIKYGCIILLKDKTEKVY